MAGFIEYGIFSSLRQDNVSEREREKKRDLLLHAIYCCRILMSMNAYNQDITSLFSDFLVSCMWCAFYPIV